MATMQREHVFIIVLMEHLLFTTQLLGGVLKHVLPITTLLIEPENANLDAKLELLQIDF
jgi:hypothetical protein